MGRPSIDLKNKKFGRLRVLQKLDTKLKNYKHTAWVCKCSCGEVVKVLSNCLRTGQVRSCGCLRRHTAHKNFFVHGEVNTPTYRSWKSMLNRIYGKDLNHAKYYSKVSICKRWHTFLEFKKDMGCRPENTTIHRVDNSKGYYKNNCVWASATVQQRNTRRNRLITFNSKTLPMCVWAENYAIPYETLRMRLSRHWTIKRALLESVRKH